VHGTAEAVAATDREPVLVNGAGEAARIAGAAPGAVVLKTAVGVVARAGVHRDVVELAQGHVVEVVPDGAPVVGGVEAAVAADNQVPAVLGINPQRMGVGMDAAAEGGKRLATVGGAVLRDAEDVDVVGVAGIDADLAEIHGPRVDTVDAGPGLAAVR